MGMEVTQTAPSVFHVLTSTCLSPPPPYLSFSSIISVYPYVYLCIYVAQSLSIIYLCICQQWLSISTNTISCVNKDTTYLWLFEFINNFLYEIGVEKKFVNALKVLLFAEISVFVLYVESIIGSVR